MRLRRRPRFARPEAVPDAEVVLSYESPLHQVGRLQPNGAVDHLAGCVDPAGITTDLDGYVWVACLHEVIRMTESGIVTHRVDTGNDSANYSITSGPDGNLWVTSERRDSIVRITR